MVIGVEEPVLVKGIGELIAKVDSGNSGYNVIHGEDIIVQGNIITFKTFNKDGDERRVSKKIKDSIKINIGGGHIQDRPVVELDVQFGGEDYKKVPFSITNRSDNEHKILISKDFVGNELEALIDVTKDNISNDGINVDYVTEGLVSGLKNMSNKVSNVVGTFTNGTEKQGVFGSKWDKRLKGMLGQDIEGEKSKSIDPKLEEEVKAIGKLDNQLKADADLIRKQLPSQAEKLSSIQVTIKDGASKDDIPVFKLLDYTGGTNIEGKNANPQYKERLEQALKAAKNFKYVQPEDKIDNPKFNSSKSESEEFVTEATEGQDSTQNNGQPAQSAAQADKKEEEGDNSPTTQVQGSKGMKEVSDMSESEVNEILTDLQSRRRAIFYIINFKNDSEGNVLVTGEDTIKPVQTVIDSWNTKIAQGKDWSFKAFEGAAKEISNAFKDVSEPRGLFAYCSGTDKDRSVEFYTNGLFPTNLNSSEEGTNENDISEFVEEYNQLNAEYQKLGGEGNISEDNINVLLQNGGQPQDEMSTFIEEYNSLNNEYLKIADDMGQSGDSINEQDIQALIELAQESAQNKRSDELGQTDQGDMYDETNYSYHTENESEERKIK